MAKNIFKFLTIATFFIAIAMGIALKFVIPESINLVAGQSQEICYNVPLKVDIYNEDNILVSDSSIQPVSENIQLDLSTTAEVFPLKEGVTKAKVSAFGIPLKEVSVNIIAQKKVIPCGTIIGVVMKADGILVLGTGGIKDSAGVVSKPAEGVIKTGDLILSCNGISLEKKEDLIDSIKKNNGEAVSLEVKREDKKINVKLSHTKSETGEYKIGAWVRDSTQGLGTVTFIDPNTRAYGALGHGVYDVDTKIILPIESGMATLSQISSIKKGENGSPGEVCGKLDKDHVIGSVEKNTTRGIYGKLSEKGANILHNEAIEIGFSQEIKEGEATILSDILGNGVEEYKVNIESINRFSISDKGMVVRVIDERLLEKTGGIVQGMSGSPIIQNGKIIGAVTHVFVKDSAKGYGIFIENMLAETQAIS